MYIHIPLNILIKFVIMLDIYSVKSIINDFSEKYNFIGQKDIEWIEKSKFDIKNYNKIRGKKFVSIYEDQRNDTIEIEFGTILINIDRLEDGEEYYSIDKNILFSINTVDFLYKETLIEEIIIKCKIYNLI